MNCKPSTHKAEVVSVRLTPHPNADTLSVAHVFGYTCCVKTDDWRGIEKAVYVVPDSVVDVRRPEFSFLADHATADGKARVKARKLRGVVSYGLLIPAPADAQVGDDLAERLGVQRYEPPEPRPAIRDKFIVGGEEEDGPDIDTGPAKYDVESFERYHELLTPGEPVHIAEKLDGSNCRAVWWEGRLWVRTRNRWVKRTPDYSHVSVEGLTSQGVPEDKATEIVARLAAKKPQVNGFWDVIERNHDLWMFLHANPGVTVFGEVYGNVNRIKYGLPGGNAFAAFDVYRDGRFLDAGELRSSLIAARVPQPTCYANGFAYSFDLVKSLSQGNTEAADAKPGTIREGVVVRPVRERYDPKIGRVTLKCVNPDFLAR